MTFLLFVDRAHEIRALFTSPQPGARLLALLAQTFQPQSASGSPVTGDAVFETDPRQWSFAQLEYWVKQIDRDIAPDEVSVGPIRRCVLYRSELIWSESRARLEHHCQWHRNSILMVSGRTLLPSTNPWYSKT